MTALLAAHHYRDDPAIFLVGVLVLATLALFIYVIRERSAGSDRRALRRRRAREVLRAERETEHQIASKLPRAVAHTHGRPDDAGSGDTLGP